MSGWNTMVQRKAGVLDDPSIASRKVGSVLSLLACGMASLATGVAFPVVF
jgi:hypothetical protein